MFLTTIEQLLKTRKVMQLSLTKIACGSGYMRNPRRHALIRSLMRITLSYMILLLGTIQLLTASTGVSQELHQMTVTMSAQQESLKTVLKRIEKKTGLSFVMPMNEVETYTVVSLPKMKRDIKTTLDLVLAGTHLGYRQINKRSILIYVKSKEQGKASQQELSTFDSPSIAFVVPQVTGRVTDEKGEGLPGVSILVKGTQQGAITDEKGHFQLNVSPGAVLVFSFVGYETTEITVGNESHLEVALKIDERALEEVVVVGYGVQKKTSVTAAVSSMKGEEIASVPTTNLSNNLGGRLSGVIVKQGSGEPGRDGSNIYIRGISTTGATQPLLIVDGIPRSFQQLDPNSIESFTVLKDAAAVAPYGVAGANGVVLVTTKKGKTGQPTITYNGYVGFQNPTALPEYVNSVEFATLKNEIARSEGLPLPYDDDALRKFADGSDPDIYSPDYVLDFVITKNSPMTYHNVEMTGGTDKIKYYAGFGYLYQQGMWETTYSNRYNLNINLEGKVSNYTTVSLNLNGRINAGHYPNSDQPANATGRILELIGYAHPGYGPMIFSNGLYGRHVMPAIYGSGYLKDRTTGIFTQLNIEQELPFLSGFKLKGTIAYDPTFYNTKGWATPLHLATVDTSKDPYVINDGIFGETKPSIRHDVSQSQQFTYQAGFDYAKSLGNHNLGVLGLFEARANDSWSLGATRRNYNLYIDEINMGSSSSSDMTTAGTSSKARQIGLVYRVAYDYMGKYLFEASGRYDGHYYFAPDKRFGFFPAFSAGWRISEENFLKDKFLWLNNLKIRASYGEVGALAGSAFQYLSTYNVSGPGYVIGGNAVQIVSERAEPNPNITWERARKSDIGLEIGLLNNRINVEFDYFYEKRSNMLVAPDVITPLEYGIGLSQVNAGIMENRGVELAAGFNIRPSKDFSIQLNGTFTYAKNKLLQTFENTVTYNNPNRRRTGKPLGTQFGYQAIGFFQQNDFNDDGSLKEGIAVQPWGAVRPGDIRYADLNNDGKIDVNDETAIGDPNQSPRIIYGFAPRVEYKNWSLDILFQGAAKTHLYHVNEMAWAFFNGMNAYKENLDYWRPDNTDAKHPRLTGAPTANNSQTSSFWMRNAAYLRLKNATLSFRIPETIASKVGLHNARIYASGQNIITWSKLIYWDPESTFRSYPQQKVLSFGVNFSL